MAGAFIAIGCDPPPSARLLAYKEQLSFSARDVSVSVIVGPVYAFGNTFNVHEASIAQAIVEQLCERAQRERIESITRVFVRVGVLTSVVPEALQFAWDIAIEGTPASGASLQIDVVSIAIYCAACAREQTIESSTLPICPECGASSNDIVRGRELLVSAMEVRYAASAGGDPTEHPAQERYAGA